MKLLVDVNPIYQGKLTGVGYFTDELLKHLSTQAKLTGFAFNFRGQKDIKLSFPVLEQKILPGKMLTLPRYLGIDLPLSCFFKSSGVDAVLGTNFLIPPTKAKATLPVIYDLCFVDHPEWVQSRNRHILAKMLPNTLRRSAGAIVISNFTKERLIKIYNYKKPILVVGIPPKITTKASKPRSLNDIKDFFLFIGTIEPRKNISTLLDSYEELPIKIQEDHKLVLAGKPGWDPIVLDRLRSSKNRNIIYLEYVTEAERNWLYSNAITTVNPSHYEGFGMPPLESVGLGAPTICSDIPAHREIFEDTGLYFKPTDKQTLLKELVKFTVPSFYKTTLAIQQRVLSRYSWDETSRQVMDFITQMAGNKE